MKLSLVAGLLLGLLVSNQGFADRVPEPPPDPNLPPPPLVEHSLVEVLPTETKTTTVWTVALVAGGTSVVLTAWGLGTALADLDSPGGPPLGITIAGVAWSTALLALAGLAVDYLFHGP